MTELELYKFVTKNNIEFNSVYDSYSDHIVWMFIPFHLLDDFNKLLGVNITDDEGIDVVFKNGYLCFELNYICSYYDIDYKNIFES